MTIHCPCDKIAEPKIVNGVIMYEHEDGTSCKLLNRFYVNKCVSYAWKLCKNAIIEGDHKSFNTYMIEDEEALAYLYEYIKFANKQELVHVLVFLFDGNDVKVGLQQTILYALITEYGNVAYKNIKAIRSKKFINDPLMNQVSAERSATGKSKMFNIESYVNIENNTAKQNIVNDLARSFLLDKVMRDSTLKNAIKSFSR